MPHVVEGGVGAFTKSSAKIEDIIRDWLRDDELLAQISSKAEQGQASHRLGCLALLLILARG